eukprot:791150-Amphidinium_carterae.1
MAFRLGDREATLERGPRPRRCGPGLALLEQCRHRVPRAPDRRPRGAQGQVGHFPHSEEGCLGHPRPPGQARLGAGL